MMKKMLANMRRPQVQVVAIFLLFGFGGIGQADVVDLGALTNDAYLIAGNTTKTGRDQTGTLFEAPNVGYNSAVALFDLDPDSPVSDGAFLDFSTDDSIKIDLLYDNPNPTTGGAFVLRLSTATWDGSQYHPTGEQHSHEFINWVNDGTWNTYEVSIDSFSDPIDDLSKLTQVFRYSLDAVQWDAVNTPYEFGVASFQSSVPEPATITPLIFGGIVFQLKRRRSR
jgi:hypothetical protein